MSSLQPVRGTKDLAPEQYIISHYIQETARKVSSLYGFQSISLPIFENTSVFSRTLGDTSDIVNKEMYTFMDRSNNSITLRPEFTASIARFFIHNGMHHKVPLRLFTSGPVFRYERPQKGRQREFTQINAEIIGTHSPECDAELIALAHHILQEFGLLDKIRLDINSLGDKESWNNYRTALVKYLTPYASKLSPTSQERLKNNPIRILDTKDDNEKEILKNAPVISEYYTSDAKNFFTNMLSYLDALQIKYNINHHLVRGLDYYCHTAFEFITDSLGAQGTVLGGGRYDNLIELMGGKPTPAIGFACGVERIMEMINYKATTNPKIAILPMTTEAHHIALQIGQQIRHHNIQSSIYPSGAITKRLAKIHKNHYSLAIIIGEDEIKNNNVTLKNLRLSSQTTIPLNDIIPTIKNVL